MVQLDHDAGTDVVVQIVDSYGIDRDLVRLGWCGADPAVVSEPAGIVCVCVQGSVTSSRV